MSLMTSAPQPAADVCENVAMDSDAIAGRWDRVSSGLRDPMSWRALGYIVASTNYTQADPSLHEQLAISWKASHASGMVHGVGSFLILFFGGRWMLRGPKLLDRWIDGDGQTQDEGFVPSDSTSANNRSEQDVDLNT